MSDIVGIVKKELQWIFKRLSIMNVRYKYLTVTFGKLNTNEILWDGSKM